LEKNMPVTIDFDNGVDPNTATNVTATGQGVSYTDEGIDFTLSAFSLDGTGRVQFGGTSGSATRLFMNDQGGDDTYLLDWGGEIVGTAGSQIVLDAGGTGFAGNWLISMTHSTLGGTQTGTMNATGDTLSFTGTFTGIKFTSLNGGSTAFMGLDSITAESITCFLGDVLVETADGKKEVQDLVPGDSLVTADGGRTTVRWIGKQPINTMFSDPKKVNPVLISAGSISEGIPSRNLVVSPDHAIAIEGVLYNASALINGVTIGQLAHMPRGGFVYYHIETDTHELILAEDCLTETFIDYAGRGGFENANEAEARTIPEIDLPRVSSARLVPDHIRARLAANAVAA
jgi:hypothetical protein